MGIELCQNIGSMVKRFTTFICSRIVWGCFMFCYICIYYYMSCSVSRPLSCPDVPVSARVRRTRADADTRGIIHGVTQNKLQNKTRHNLFITYIQQKAVSYMLLGTHKDKIR